MQLKSAYSVTTILIFRFLSGTGIAFKLLRMVSRTGLFIASFLTLLAFSGVESSFAQNAKSKQPKISAAKKKIKKRGAPAASARLPLCMSGDGVLFAPSNGKCPNGDQPLTIDNLVSEGAEGFPGVDGTDGADGADGEPGADGADGEPGEDGSLRIYGDGSAGELNISSNLSYDESNNQFTDVTINAGAVLTVPSGTVIRCSGTFTNRGTIIVTSFSEGARRELANSSTVYPALRQADAGNAVGSPGNGEVGTASADVLGGQPARALLEAEAKQLLRPGLRGGAGGGAGFGDAGNGGGTLVILCKNSIVNDASAGGLNGTISANGLSGSANQGGGGGAGGIIILASQGSINNVGVIAASGARGGSAGTNAAAGGGGGGGIIHLIAESVNPGTTTVSGGTAGDTAGITINVTRRAGGGAGGSLGGKGGTGATALGSSKPALSGEDGEDGHVLETETDPTALF